MSFGFSQNRFPPSGKPVGMLLSPMLYGTIETRIS
ncbi:hypothetical protein BQ8482_110728 [Mesorhizobium delmotii]|uniref:Uncharacterized protein n=1 Tax=Mesorhizobium delmotii TaxID=1631247 RepID=A0A2P9ACF3_9HYPH|nr:hypothetical protein BQ8482_110728 [Mesorhizobium delmotii]